MMATENGDLHVPLLSGLRLRVWAEGYEVVELDWREVAALHDLALWPAAGATLHLVGATTPVAIRYFIGARVAVREISGKTDAWGRIAWPGTPRGGIRVEIVDPRFTLAGVTLHAGDEREWTLQRAQCITARVLDSDGRPMSRAKASSFIPIGPAPNDVRRLDWTSAENGVMTLSGFPAGDHVVEFAAEGFASKSVRVNAKQTRDVVRVYLRRGAPLVLMIRGDDGPIEQASVFLEDGNRISTDRSGRVTIEGLDLRQQPELQITATDYLPVTIDARPDMKSPYEVHLRRGAGFRFRLLDGSTGDPIEHTRVRVRTGTRWQDRELHGIRGEYFAAGFGGGRMQLRISASGYLPMTTSAEAADGTSDFGVLFLSRGAVVSGTIVDAQTGQPLAGARVETVPREAIGTLAARLFGDTISTTTNVKGRFALSGLEPGVLCASVSHPSTGQMPLPLGHVDENSTRDVGVVSVGETTSLDGTLRDSAGSPVSDASLELRFGPVYSPCLSLSAAVDDKGKYRFDRITPGQYHLVALRNHEVLGTRDVFLRGTLPAHEDLELRTVAVHGLVVVQDLPGSGGAVLLKRAGSDDFIPPTIFFGYTAPGVDRRQRPATDIVGKISFSVGPEGTFDGKGRLDPGNYEVIWTPADNSAWYYSAVSLNPDATTLDIQLRFEGVPISGRASAADTSPVARALIRLIDTSGHVHRMTFAGADGAFVIPHVPPGRWIIEAAGKELKGRQTVDVEADPPGPLQLVLMPKQPSRLVIQTGNDPDGVPIDSIVVTNAAGVVRMSRANPDATFADLPAGTYKIFGCDQRGGIVAGDVVTIGLATSSTTLTSRPTRNLRIRCNAEPGQRVALLSEHYSLAGVLAYEGFALSVLDDGTIALPPLSDGRWTIRIGDRAHEIEVSRDETFDLRE